MSTLTYEAAPETEATDDVTFEDNGGITLVTGRTTFPTFRARELYAAGGAERGLAQCHERLDGLLAALASPPLKGLKARETHVLTCRRPPHPESARRRAP